MARGGVDPDALRRVLAEAWSLDVDTLTRVPFGYAAASYVADRQDAPSVVVKVWPPMQVPRPATLELARRLDGLLVSARVPAPLPTAEGDLTAMLRDHVVGVFPFVDGRHLGGWDDPYCARLPVALAELHGAATLLADLELERDAFAMDAARELRDGIAETDRRRNDGGAVASLARFLDDERVAIIDALERLDAVGRRARDTQCDLVVCHSDSGGNNCLVDGDGALWLLDWDDAVLAPPEEDLKTAAHLRVPGRHDVGAFVHAYATSPAARPLHLEHLEFFVLRRPIEDLAADVWRILRAEDPDPEARIETHRVSDWSVRRFGQIDSILAELATALGGVTPPR